ncbi:hypothetical protein Tco_0714353 [Tanacetum coccineum]
MVWEVVKLVVKGCCLGYLSEVKDYIMLLNKHCAGGGGGFTHRRSVPPHSVRVVVAVNIIHNGPDLAYGNHNNVFVSAPMKLFLLLALHDKCCSFHSGSSHGLTPKKESLAHLAKRLLVCYSNPLIAVRLGSLLFFDSAVSIEMLIGCSSYGFCLLVLSLMVFVFCCYSILLLREDLSRNLELTESTPSLGEDCWE